MIKQVLVLRHDLNMRKGKMVSQGAHAAIGALKQASAEHIKQWEEDGCTKICVYVPDESALLELSVAVSIAGLPTYLVQGSYVQYQYDATFPCCHDIYSL